jgi:hypothetical protein
MAQRCESRTRNIDGCAVPDPEGSIQLRLLDHDPTIRTPCTFGQPHYTDSTRTHGKAKNFENAVHQFLLEHTETTTTPPTPTITRGTHTSDATSCESSKTEPATAASTSTPCAPARSLTRPESEHTQLANWLSSAFTARPGYSIWIAVSTDHQPGND